MKNGKLYRALLTSFVIGVLIPALSYAQPPSPGGGGSGGTGLGTGGGLGSDPFGGVTGAPVNGGIVVMVIVTFIYGVHRINDIQKKKRAAQINK